MKQSKHNRSGIRTFPMIVILALVTSLTLVPIFFVSDAQTKRVGKGLFSRTAANSTGVRNYDIRLDKNSLVKRGLMRVRDRIGADVSADLRERIVQGEKALKAKLPELKIEFSPETGVPEVVGPDARSERAWVDSARGGDRAEAVKGFLRANTDLFGVPEHQVDDLVGVADYTNPAGNMSWVILEQKIEGIPVFRGEVVAGFGKDGSLARVVNGLAAGIDLSSVSREFNEPDQAVVKAASHLGQQIRPFELQPNGQASDSNRTVFGDAEFGIVAEKMYFPLEPGLVFPAWRVLIRQEIATYYVIVDARSGELLWRKNLTEDQTQSASYRVYAYPPPAETPSALPMIPDSPFPITPGPTSPSSSIQGAAVPRILVTRIGNEPPYEFNNLGWLTDGSTTLDGNNVQAGLDRESPNDQGPDRANGIDPNGVPAASSDRTFDFALNPATPSPTGNQTGDAPLPAGQTANVCLAAGTAPAPNDFQKAVTTQLFYVTNLYHDEMYRLGFTEQHRNFQHDNFGRGGLGNDRISAQAQDCSSVNNANFATPADGSRPTMQMFIFTAPNIDIDASLDTDIVIHELTHGLSNRLHANAGGLGSLDFSRGMGEGWSDFYAHAMLSEAGDPINGIYTTGAYATYQFGFANSYYGIRRFPKAVMAFTGGPNNRPHNPLTFQDIDSTKMNLTDGAFPPAFTGTADQVHNVGEVWSSALWEVRARMVQRLGWAEGNRRVLQLVTDGMKLSPASPNFLTGRDAIVAAARAGGTAADVEDVWRGFAVRGIGFSASIQGLGGISTGGTNSIRVTEAFDMPNLVILPAMTVSDSLGDGDGFPEPGETLRLTISLTNNSGDPATDVWVEVVGGQTLAYGTIANNGMASNVFDYILPAELPCGAVVDVTINVTSSLGPVTFTRKIFTGQSLQTAAENFDVMTPPAFSNGWQVTNEANGGLNPFVLATTSPDTSPNAAFAPNPNASSGVQGTTSIVSPSYPISSSSASVSFRHRYNTEASWDGGVLEISIDGAPFQDILTAGGSFEQNGYNGFLNDNDNPIDLRSAWTGNSNGYITSVARLPVAAAGKQVQLRWRFGTDNNTGVEGWYVDSIAINGRSQCFVAGAQHARRADFDGDGRSDVSVFRPSTRDWHILGSRNLGYFGVKWGETGDQPVPADYDNDGKTDFAVYRPGTGGGANGYFFVLNSKDLTFTAVTWGILGDIPVVRDYDGDGRDDFALYRPSDLTWYVSESDGGYQGVQWGVPGGKPVPGDYDGDGNADMTYYDNGTWGALLSSNGPTWTNWGVATDIPVQADYDGDGADDYSIFRPSDGTWWLMQSSVGNGSHIVYGWGISTDVPAPGDFDGDGKYDPAIFRDGSWWILLSTGGHTGYFWGNSTDIPLTKPYIP